MPISPLTTKLSADSSSLEVTTTQVIPKEYILKQKKMLQEQMDILQARMDVLDGQLSMFPSEKVATIEEEVIP